MILLVLAAVIAGWITLRGSLPALDGTRALPGLGAETVVERDAYGIPTIRAATLEDASRALGFLHAQERFFQMDLLRRQSVGELSELFGPAALPMDRDNRLHRFRHRAAALIAALDARQLGVLDAYTAGVNSGLASLSARPWEYFPLRSQPRPWSREDTLFVIETMTLTLQEHDGGDERTRLALDETYGSEALAFLKPCIKETDAALDGSVESAPPIPDATHLTPRAPPFSTPAVSLLSPASPPSTSASHSAAPWFLPPLDPDAVFGSNSFALGGKRTASGAALVANDMHLTLAVPNAWYRASIVLPGRTVTGVTLPGVPCMVVGSNGDIAWAFTDGYIDNADVVIVERDPADPTRYRVPDGDGWEKFEVARETIAVARGASETQEILSTRWGPVIVPRDGSGRTLALHWQAYEPGCIDLRVLNLMDARSVDEAVAVAHRVGLPAQNMIVGDRAGNIAWTIIGPVPRRVGFDGRLPQSWADGTRRWDGFLPPDDVPVVRNPADGQLWSANHRAVGGHALDLLGYGGYDYPARASQIRDDLSALADHPAVPADGLAVQLDNRSIFLARWRTLLEQTLASSTAASDPALLTMRQLVQGWHGRADPSEAGHRLVREFRQNVTELVLNPIYEPVRQHDPTLEISRTRFRDCEQPLWAIVTQRPAHLLPAPEPSWDALLLHAARLTSGVSRGSSQPNAEVLNSTWGDVNTLQMRHPLSRSPLLSWLSPWLDMPARQMPGDRDMPRVQGPNFGASERMVVSPGRENEGIFHQPGGANGHPMSPYYRAGHDDWVQGKPAPFLPGATQHRLVLRPSS